MRFGHSERDSVGDRIGGRIGDGNAALALAASRLTAAAFARAAAAFTLACGRSRFAACRASRCTLTAGLAATGRQQPTGKSSAEAKLGPEFERAVHGKRYPSGREICRGLMAQMIMVRKRLSHPEPCQRSGECLKT